MHQLSEIQQTANYWQSEHAAGRFPDYEVMLQAAYERFLKPGDVVVDVGVHVGRHLQYFQEIVGSSGRVIGFEPVPAFIVQSLKLCQPQTEIRQLALSDQPGTSEFLFMVEAPGESGFKERVTPAERGATPIKVTISTLDEQAKGLSRLDYIKIDTEGHEISVIKGGRTTIESLRPVISVEWGQPTYELYGHSKPDIYNIARSMNYHMGDLFGNVAADLDEWMRVSDWSYWDFFMIPEEKVSNWAQLLKST